MSENDSSGRLANSSNEAPIASGTRTAEVLREVLEDQAQREARQKTASKTPPRKRLLPLPVLATFWGAACLFVWVATPEFLLPDPLPEPSAEQLEAGLRMDMLVLVSEISRYQAETGTVPEQIDRIYAPPPVDIRYTPIPPDTYRLTGTRGGAEISYQAGQPLDELRADAREIIQGRAGGSS